MKEVKIIIEKHSDGYVAYPVGIKGVVVGQGDTYEEALRDGGIAIGVTPHSSDDAAKVKDKFKELKGENIITV